MIPDDDIKTRLAGFTGLSGTKIYFITVPDTETPKPQTPWSGIVISRVDDTPTICLDGSVAIEEARFQFSCMSNVSHRAARDLAQQVRLALQNYVGGSIEAASFAGGSMDLYDDETRMHHIPIDFFITYH